MEKKLIVQRRFDPATCRHYLNEYCTVIHCHHYITLYTQLANDAVDFEGERLLKETAEDVFYQILKEYFVQHRIDELAVKVQLAEEYWQTVGMGMIHFSEVGKYTVVAKMPYSHFDQGWLTKWGKRDTPINSITVGFVAAMAALFDNRERYSYAVTELTSITCGDEQSIFKAVLK